MQTGQNSIAPENSLPQLGQVRWGSVLMFLTALQPEPKPSATPRSTEWCEIRRHSAWHTFVPLHAELGVSLLLARQGPFRNKIPTGGVLRHPRVVAKGFTMAFVIRLGKPRYRKLERSPVAVAPLRPAQ